MRITVEPCGGWTVLHLHGELDLATAPTLRRHVGQVVQATAERAPAPSQAQQPLQSSQSPAFPLPSLAAPAVVLDLADLVFCDSSGLSALIGAYKQIVRTGGGHLLLLLHPRPRLAHMLTITGLDRYLTIATHLPTDPVETR
ncbi:STAS domain-containing protein [Actinomadura kijaniata]|uniref:STAS domain-containing protein n=1 Tax=Actinomadura kijaniata TaxID=46161 RepID=UPI003F1BDB05